MRITFLESVAGANYAYDPEETVDLPPEQARAFVKRGQAVLAVDAANAAAPEAAVTGPAETAMQPRARRRNLRNLGGLLAGQ